METSFGGNHKLYLEASYVPGTTAMSAYMNADVPDGTAGTLRVDGPVSWTCEGVFHNHNPIGLNDYTDLPRFAVDGSDIIQFTGPSGKYTFTISLPAQKATLKQAVTGGLMNKDANGSWFFPKGCVAR